MPRFQCTLSVLFADVQVVIANSEDNLQRGLYALHQTVQTFGMEISYKKTKIMVFKGTEPIRSKIVIDNMILEQVNTFTYLGCNISYQKEKDTHSKITKFLQILGFLNNTLKPNLVQRGTRLKLYKTLALPTLLYGSAIWTIKQCDKNRLRPQK
jgi:hypothetical protein